MRCAPISSTPWRCSGDPWNVTSALDVGRDRSQGPDHATSPCRGRSAQNLVFSWRIGRQSPLAPFPRGMMSRSLRGSQLDRRGGEVVAFQRTPPTRGPLQPQVQAVDNLRCERPGRLTSLKGPRDARPSPASTTREKERRCREMPRRMSKPVSEGPLLHPSRSTSRCARPAASASASAQPTCSTGGRDGVPDVTRPERCTACRICELHCPEFAISVHLPAARTKARRGRRSGLMAAMQLIQGNEACAEGAIAAGARFFAGYPITPSTEIAEVLSRRLPQVGGRFVQMEDEIASMAAVIGASLAGRQGPHRDLRPRLLADAGDDRLRDHGPGAVRDHQRHARRPLDRPADRPGPGRCDAGALGHARRAFDHRPLPQLRRGVLHAHRRRVQPGRELPHAGDRAVRRVHRSHARRCRSAASRGDADRRAQRARLQPEEYDTTVSTVDNIMPSPPLGSRYKVRVTGLVYDRRQQQPADTGTPEVAQELGIYLREKIYHHRGRIVRVEELEMDDAEVAIFAYGSVARSAKAAMRWARRQGVQGRASSAASRCGRSRPPPSSTWPRRCAPSSCPR